MKKFDFIKGVERLINPIEVGTLHFMQFFNNLLPKSIQKKFVMAASKKTSYMGFVVEPYSTFLCYEIKDPELASKMLPDGFKLVKCQVLEDSEPKYYAVFGCINAHTSAFFGIRVEFYLMAERDIPPIEHYDDFDQIEDGIGMIRYFQYCIEKDMQNIFIIFAYLLVIRKEIQFFYKSLDEYILFYSYAKLVC